MRMYVQCIRLPGSLTARAPGFEEIGDMDATTAAFVNDEQVVKAHLQGDAAILRGLLC